jgi:hypothetical protein
MKTFGGKIQKNLPEVLSFVKIIQKHLTKFLNIKEEEEKIRQVHYCMWVDFSVFFPQKFS